MTQETSVHTSTCPARLGEGLDYRCDCQPTPSRAQLEALIARWRAAALLVRHHIETLRRTENHVLADLMDDQQQVLDRCADELAAQLSPAPVAGEEKP